MPGGIDYRKIGLKCGIEIHRRLATNKLFCKCSSLLEDEEVGEIKRCLRASKSELGEVDPAALHEFKKGKRFIYKVYKNSCCLVEMDEEPPHDVNGDALKIAIEIALLLNARVVDEVHFMRKIVIDGSNTTGFQRTAIMGLDGFIETSFGKVGIPTICLEEESAQIIEKKDKEAVYGLNRLGIPLIEISTTPVLDDPEKVKETALKLGNLLKVCRVMRGIGSIRQDINISIKDGARVEIKGVQEPSIIPTLVEMEVRRQLSLLELKKELKASKSKLRFSSIMDVSSVFKNSKCRFLKGKKVLAMKIEGFGGIFKRKLNDFRTVGREVSDYVKAKTRFKGIIHTDENLEKYGINQDEINQLKELVKADKDDLVVMVASTENHVEEMETALSVVKERVLALATHVPEETRRALDNGDTEYMRPLPGAARMYPETDVPPIRIENKIVEEIKKKLPETLDKKMERFMKELKLNRELASQIVNSAHLTLFESLIERHKEIKPKVVASLLINTLPELKAREKLDISLIKEEWIEEVVSLLEANRIAKDGVYEILKLCVKEGKAPAEVVKEQNLWKADEKEIRKLVREHLAKQDNIKNLVGLVMKELRSRADGADVARIVKEEMKN